MWRDQLAARARRLRDRLITGPCPHCGRLRSERATVRAAPLPGSLDRMLRDYATRASLPDGASDGTTEPAARASVEGICGC